MEPNQASSPSAAVATDSFADDDSVENGAARLAPSPAIVLALRRVLRPLVKLMLEHGITIQYLTELLKRLFVEVADQDFRIGDKPSTDSRVSLLTGVHRKDVSRIKTLIATNPDEPPSFVPLGTQVVSHWTANSKYLGNDGTPRHLPRLISEGGDISFEALVSSINSDIRSRVVLDELIRLGVTSIDEQGLVCLNTSAFVPSKGVDEKAFYLGHNLGDHAAAAVHNVLGNKPAFMERSVHYSGLTEASVRQLAQMSEHMGMKALLAVNQSAMEAEAYDSSSSLGDNDHRMIMGIYFYSEKVDPAKEAPSADSGEADE